MTTKAAAVVTIAVVAAVATVVGTAARGLADRVVTEDGVLLLSYEL